jgi:hypothetical protein
MPDQVFTAGQILTAQNQTDLQNNIGLTFIKSQTIGTGVTSVVVPSAFSAQFQNYKIIVTGGVASTSGLLGLTLGSANTNYFYRVSAPTAYNAATGNIGANGTTLFGEIGGYSTNNISSSIEIFQPFEAKTTGISATWIQHITAGYQGMTNGFQDSTTSFTAFTLSTAGGATLTGGTICVYGYRN